MGKSAKLHKRPKNLKKSAGGSGPGPVSSVTGGAQGQAQNARKKAGHKAKAGRSSAAPSGHVLGGVDYVSLMGGRRQAREEAAKHQLKAATG